jgi:PhnB protein
MTAFHALRAPATGAEPDPDFVVRLHTELTAALAPEIPLTDRSTTMPTTSSAADPATANPATADPATAGARSIVPYIAVRGAAAAIDWYASVFGARELVRYTGDDGAIGHAELAFGDARLMLSDEYPDYGAVSPQHLGGTPVALHIDVADVDTVCARAAAAGATIDREPADQPYGSRACQFRDPWGHRWMVQTTIADPTTAEIDAAMDGFTVTEGGDRDGR